MRIAICLQYVYFEHTDLPFLLLLCMVNEYPSSLLMLLSFERFCSHSSFRFFLLLVQMYMLRLVEKGVFLIRHCLLACICLVAGILLIFVRSINFLLKTISLRLSFVNSLRPFQVLVTAFPLDFQRIFSCCT